MTNPFRKSAIKNKKWGGKLPRDRRLGIEPLEPRLLLDGSGFINGNDVYLTLSFAADGTTIADQSNSIAAKFDAIAPTADWQDAILRAFQTWAVETNGDIGLVSDNGDPFGSPGPSQDDNRFGDIRIGGIAMSPEIGAVSVPVDGLVSGTWFADVVFNTSYNYETLEDIYAIALHEAGNVFGLEDNNDPTSPLFTGGAPTGLPPNAADLAALHQLHGNRMPDLNEVYDDDDDDDGRTDNDSFSNAAELELVENNGADYGTAPSIVYGDITDDLDRDFFKIETPEYYTGSLTIQVRSSGISLLAPRASFYDDDELLITQSVSVSTAGDLLTLSIPSVEADEKYYLEVGGAAPGLFGIGGYSLVTIFDGINEIDQSKIDSIAGGQFRFLDQENFEAFFDADEDDFFNDDLSTNDLPASATILQTTTGFVDSTRYEVVASIVNAIDVDFYSIRSPVVLPVPLGVMTVLVRSLDAGGLIPTVSVFDSNGLPVASTILANGGGEYILQIEGVTFDANYQVKVEASGSAGVFNTGNYNLTVSFGSQATQILPLSTGTVGNGTTQNIHTLYIGQPQLFHLALRVDPAATTSPTAVVATIKNDLGEVVYQIAAGPGETRSREAVFLAAGTYTVEIVPLTLDGSVPPALTYSLLGIAISDPFVGDPNDPTNNPFACTEPGQEGLFCYPGGFVSPDPFLWDDFIDSFTDPPPLPNLPTLVTLLFGDWWTWVWNRAGVNGPPFGMPDAIQVPEASSAAVAPLVLGPTGSVLDNDIDPENDPLIAILQSGPANGTLSIEPDGTFVYAPNIGFSGRDEFTYTAFDFTQESASTTVSIIVGISGDFSANGTVDGSDFLTWQRSFGTAIGAVLTDGNGDFDGDVDAQDLVNWQRQFGGPILVEPSDGDADGDGDFDGSDFLAWQRGFGTASGATAADGDADADGDVDSQDIGVWEKNFGFLSISSGGDANGDGDFDGADFLAWQRGFGVSSGAFPSNGDADADRDVDSLDLAAWAGNFGTTIAGAAAAASENISAPVFIASSSQPDPVRLALTDSNSLPRNTYLKSPYAFSAASPSLILDGGKQAELSAASQDQSLSSVKPVFPSVPVSRSEYTHSRADARDQVFADFYANRFQRIRSEMLDALGEIGEELDAG